MGLGKEPAEGSVRRPSRATAGAIDREPGLQAAAPKPCRDHEGHALPSFCVARAGPGQSANSMLPVNHWRTQGSCKQVELFKAAVVGSRAA